jgi:hypothetical protein
MHAYSLLSVFDIELNGSPVRLMKVKNPWGNGAWSDNSQEWKDANDDLKKELDFTNADDGIFFISFEDYLSNFPATSITH